MKTKFELQNKISDAEKLIVNYTDEFTDEIEDFQSFIREAIEKELFALTQNDYVGIKPNQKQFKNIVFNSHILEDIFDLMQTKQIAKYQIEKLETVLN